MAITKLMHMNEAKRGPAYNHLKHSIEYILNPDKTENGLWVGGNICLLSTKALKRL